MVTNLYTLAGGVLESPHPHIHKMLINIKNNREHREILGLETLRR